MTEEWSNILEGREVELTAERLDGTPYRIDIEAPAGFGRENYENMAQELLEEHEYQRETSLERNIEFMGEAAHATARSMYGMAKLPFSDVDDRGGELAIAIFGTGLGTFGGFIAGASAPLLLAKEETENNLMTPLSTSSDVVYDKDGRFDEEVGRVFYQEHPEGRYVRLRSPAWNRDQGVDPEMSERIIGYLEDFEV